MKRIFLILSIFSLLGAGVNAQSLSTTTFSDANLNLPTVGSTFNFPINVASIGTIYTLTIYIDYDPTVITYVGPGTIGNTTITNQSSSRLKLLTGSFPNQITIPDGKLLDLLFTFNGGTSTFIFRTSGTNRCSILKPPAATVYITDVTNGSVLGGYVSNSISTGSWAVTTNWSLGVVPNAYHNVTVTSGGTVVIGADAICNSLNIANGGQLTLDAGKTLTDNGNFTIASGGSFIQNGTLAVTGTTTVKSDIVANEWHLISAPISDAQSGMFDGKFLQTHTESTNEYSDIKTTDVPLVPMKGYAVWNASGFTANYVGTLNTGTQSIATTKDGEGWNLVGNPYPSAIDWNAASGWTKTNLNATTYLHVNSSTWATWNGATGTNGGSQYIAPGQGFFVEATGAGTLAMTDAVRVHNPVSFFKNTVNNLVRLQVSGNGYTDDAVVYFVPEASAEFDGQYDAHKLFGDVAEAAQIYTLGSSPLAINALPETNSVPVGIHAGASGTYTIAATEVNDIQAITLKDNQTGISTNLLVNSYSFSFTPGENEQRFTLYFSPLSINEVENPLASIYSNQNTLYVDLKSLSKGDIYVYNLAGQLVTSASANQGINMIRLTNTGNYIVKVITPKTTLVKKVFIQ